MKTNSHGLPVYDCLKTPRPEKTDEEREHERQLQAMTEHYDRVMCEQLLQKAHRRPMAVRPSSISSTS